MIYLKLSTGCFYPNILHIPNFQCATKTHYGTIPKYLNAVAGFQMSSFGIYQMVYKPMSNNNQARCHSARQTLYLLRIFFSFYMFYVCRSLLKIKTKYLDMQNKKSGFEYLI